MAANEARFRAALDITADAILLLDRDSMRFIDCNEATCRMLGYSRSDLQTLSPVDVGASSLTDLEAEYDKIIKGKKAFVSLKIVETQLRRKDGLLIPVEIQRDAMLSEGRWVMILVARDITERKQAESRLQQMAYYDQLTGLPNRHMFYESLKGAIIQAEKHQHTISLLNLNLHKFKEINESLGFAFGDFLLNRVGARLINNLRTRDIVGRLGNDEFGLILFNSPGSQGAATVARKILDVLKQPFNWDGREITISSNIGVTVYPNDALDAETMIVYADSALREAKRAGSDNFRYHTAEMNAKMLEKRNLHEALKKAILNEEFVLHYQPKVHIESGKWDSVEALIRWNRPRHGLVSPGQFIAALEETGMIVSVGIWVIKTVCRQIREWQNSGVGPFRIAINVSAKQFLQDDLVTVFSNAILENGIDPSFLEIEITESLLMVDAERAVRVLHELKQLGICLSIDDFGTGYSSLAYLKQFPVDKLKIDLSFIRDVTTDENDAAITMAIINLAHTLKLQVIAEGVETEEQLDFLKANNCDEFQGYYFSRPLPVPELIKLYLR